MELSWLEDFLTLASSGNFSISAAQRNMTQSAFSKRIKALEQWMGTQLIDRRTFPAGLTPAGMEFREVAQNTLNTLYAERGRLRNSLSQSTSEIRMLGATSLLLRFVPDWINELHKSFGKFSVTLRTQNFYTMVQALNDREADFVLQFSHPDLPSLYDKNKTQSLILSTEKFVPVSVAENGKPKFNLDLNQLENMPRMRYSEDSFLARVETLIYERNQSGCHTTGALLDSPIAEVIKNFVLLGKGIAWLPLSSVARELAQKTLLISGGEIWQEELEIRLYARKDCDSRLVVDIWQHLKSLQ